ncbi:monovalent cation/H+ antiporter complex subunit F [Marinilabiliaceae bacterium ANBcel2]|nr:monovalent cation/H+ antiporter complex subunit F [Marinilabiliaceae bacterium ANBcel2]
MSSLTFLSTASLLAIIIMTIAILISLIRLVKGPDLTDRIIALDQIELTIVGIILCHAIYTGNNIYMDVVLVVAFLIALGAMIITRYLYKRKIKND